MAELMPCPFCGAKAQLIEQSLQDPLGRPRVDCSVCRGGFDFCDHKSTLIRLWNSRPTPWVSIGDRLPEDDQIVIASDGEGMEFVVYRNNLWLAMFQPLFMSPTQPKDDNIIQGTTHWMPLPELPEVQP